MANDGGFEGRVGFVEGKLRSAAARSRDIALNLEKSSTLFANFAKSAEKADQKMRDIANRMERLNELGDKVGFDKLSKDFRKFSAQKQGLKFLDLLDQGFSKITKSITTLGSGVIAGVFNFLVDSIKRVYELQERWTRAIGGFNMKIGGMTAGLKQAQRAATAWSGTIRGLTNGDIQEGIQMFEEFTMAMSRIVRQGDTWSKFGLQLARGFNLGGDGAGRLAATFEDMGASGKEAVGVMSELIDSANLVGVPVNQLAGDVVEANTYMARFGKEGAKGFVTAAGYARKFAMSMRELQAATEKFDLFDDSAQTAAKLNATFGTLINSVDLMLMDDPAQRMETIRQSLLAQGRTYDTLSIKERRFAAETLGVNEQQLATLLSLKDAGFTYTEMIEKQQAKEAKEAEAKRRMQVQLQKTAQTMYAFGAAFDRITVAIAKAIRPLLEVLGLAKAGGKDFKSFGQVMESVTQHIIHFFESLAENPKWIGFMKDLARGMRDVGKAVGNFIMSGKAAKWAGELAGFLHDVYDWGKKAFSFMIDAARMLEGPLKFVLKHIKEIAAIWVGFQAVKLGMGIKEKVGGMAAMFGPSWDPDKIRRSGSGVPAGAIETPGGELVNAAGEALNNDVELLKRERAGKRARRARIGRGLKFGAGAALLAGVGTYAAGGSMGASIGSGVGSGLGTAVGAIFGGPIGAAIGGALGGFLGEKVGGWVQSLFGSGKSKLDIARENLKAAMDEMAGQTRRFESILGNMSRKREMEDNRRQADTAMINRLDREARKNKGKVNELTAEEALKVRTRIEEMQRLGVTSKATKHALATLKDGGKITDAELRKVAAMSKEYESKLEELRNTTQKKIEQEIAQLQASGIALQAGSMDLKAKETQVRLDEEKRQLQKLEKGQIEVDLTQTKEFQAYLDSLPSMIKKSAKNDEAFAKQLSQGYAIDKQRQKVKNLEIDLVEQQEKAVRMKMDLDRKLFLVQLRGAIMQETRFMEFEKSMRAAGVTNQNAIFQNYLSMHAGEFKDLYGKEDFEALFGGEKAMASGGIVRRPTRALIGEGGPEAVIPLRALARGRGPSRVTRGARGAVNLASQSAGGSTTTVQVISSDVHIDGVKAGKAITKIAISTAEN